MSEQGEEKANRIASQVGIDQSLLGLIIAEVPAEPVEHPKTEQRRAEELSDEDAAFVQRHIVITGQLGGHEDETQRKDESDDGSNGGNVFVCHGISPLCK